MPIEQVHGRNGAVTKATLDNESVYGIELLDPSGRQPPSVKLIYSQGDYQGIMFDMLPTGRFRVTAPSDTQVVDAVLAELLRQKTGEHGD